jgi:hypothetical protein
MSEVRLTMRVEDSRLILKNEGTITLRHVVIGGARTKAHHYYRPIPLIKPGEEVIADHSSLPSAPPDLENLGVSFQVGDFKRSKFSVVRSSE